MIADKFTAVSLDPALLPPIRPPLAPASTARRLSTTLLPVMLSSRVLGRVFAGSQGGILIRFAHGLYWLLRKFSCPI